MHAVHAIMLIFSNLFILPALFYTYVRNYIPSFAVLFRMYVVSMTYHACHAEWYCLSPLDVLHAADYLSVWLSITWFALFALKIDDSIIIGLIFIFQTVFVVFTPLLVHSMAFSLGIVVVIFILFIQRTLLFDIPLTHYDLKILGIVIFLFGTGTWFNWSSNSIYSKDFLWKHPIWHELSMIGILFLIAMMDRIDLIKAFHLLRKKIKNL